MVGECAYDTFIGGKLRLFYSAWAEITSDPNILEMVTGLNLEFESGLPNQNSVPFPIKMNPNEKLAIDLEIQKLLGKGVIEESWHEEGEFISNIFTRPKKDGGLRMILNLKQLNEGLEYHHFKMDTFTSAIRLVTEGCFMASIDLKDAYYSVPIAEEHQKYLKFEWRGVLYQFKALPNGLSSGPRKFTKLLKPPFSVLRHRGHVIIGYIDDTLLLGKTKEAVTEAVADTTELLQSLGFTIHQEKSVFEPEQKIVFLGFEIDSVTMTVKLTQRKIEEIMGQCLSLKRKRKITIHEVASLIGKLVAAFPGVQYGALHYRELEKNKIAALRRTRGDYQAFMSLDERAHLDLDWWLDNVQNATGAVLRKRADIVIETDASGLGWGAFDGINRIGGRWNEQEALRAAFNQINYLELWAGYLALRALCHDKTNKVIKLKMDNTTAIAYINNMGGVKSSECNVLAKEIWEFCQERDLWVMAVHLPGVQNVIADRLSRQFDEQLEWQLDRQVFIAICERFGTPEVDLFASRLNAQLPRFVSWKPDPDAEAIDALTLYWGDLYFYAFPPFCLIGQCLQKIVSDRAEGLVILPFWPTQPWYPQLAYLLTEEPIILPKSKYLLTNAMTGEPHPLKKLQLLCCRLSAKALDGVREERSLRRLWTSSWVPGGLARRSNTTQHIRNGYAFANRDVVIRFGQL